MLHPWWYFGPFGITLVLLILGARYITYTGEAKLLREPTVILGAALMWPLTVPVALVGLVFLVGGKAIGVFVPKKK